MHRWVSPAISEMFCTPAVWWIEGDPAPLTFETSTFSQRCVWDYVCSEVSKFPTNSDTGVLHLPITKGVWTPVSPLPPTFFSPSGHPVCPCPGREAPRSLSAVPWGKVKAVISMTGRRRRAKEECYKSEPHSHLSQLRETQSNLSFKGEDEEEERLTPQWWIQKHKCIFFLLLLLLTFEHCWSQSH